VSGLDIFAWIVLIVMIICIVAGFVILAGLPGKIAKQREHPQADAINVAGWLGALALGVFWPLALVWAFTHSSRATPITAQADVKERNK
jgi:amino acid transporter